MKGDYYIHHGFFSFNIKTSGRVIESIVVIPEVLQHHTKNSKSSWVQVLLKRLE